MGDIGKATQGGDDSQATQGGDDTGEDQDVTSGDDTGTGVDDTGTDASDGDQGDEDKPLGPKGEKALEAEKAKRRQETQRRRALEAELAKLRDSGGDEAEKARREAEQAAQTKANTKILKAEVRAAAAGKLADPADALKLLDLDQFEVDGDGEVDTDEISSAIDTLLKSKPYLAAAANGSGKRFQGSGDGGARGKAQSLDQQILAAEQKGDWKAARQLKLQKMTAGNKQ
ncbi:MAG: hypothetical protein ACRDQH_18205 [Pseudonocardiaceae bacterium]